ncbi:MAG: purine permease [Treponema sp.]|jgi:NCS2 family nucleobase:cation symporter-2|nr:purine permease [Treponema sp.]
MAEKQKPAAAVDDRQLIYQLDGRPSLAVALPLGLQHVLAMFVGNLAPVLILTGLRDAAGVPIATPEQRALMVQAAMFASGATTFLQLYGFKIGKLQVGGRLPIVMGTAFAFVPAMTSVGIEFGMGAVLGATLLGSVVEMLMGIFYKQIEKVFPPLIIGVVLVSIGLSLLPAGVNYFAGGAGAKDFGSPQNLLLGSVVLLTIIGVQKLGKGMIKLSAILFGIIVGYALAIIMGKVDFTQVTNAKIISIPLPFFINPAFHLEFIPQAIMTMAFIYVVSGLETMGNTNGITVAAFDREATAQETGGSIIADAFGGFIASFFCAPPNTAFGQNAGIVAMTKVVNRFCVATGAIVLVFAGLFPKVGALFSIMPQSVLGGAVLTVFSMITINGMKLIAKAGFSQANLTILSITLGLGYAVALNKGLTAHFPAFLRDTIYHDTTVAVCVVGVLANLIFREREKKAAA